jgi:CRISPR-associated protein Csd1
MILQALYDYYKRKLSESESNVPPVGWVKKEIPFLVVIDKEGNFVGFQDTREKINNRLQARPFLVPSLGEKKGSGVKANLLWENIEYMFGIPVSTASKPKPNLKRVRDQHKAFQEKIDALPDNSPLIRSIKKFINNDNSSIIKKDAFWDEVLKVNQNLLIAIDGIGTSTEIPEIKEAIDSIQSDSGNNGVCLVSGEKKEIVRLEPAIKGVSGPDGKAERAFVSFNLDAFCSYGKIKNYNAPIGKDVSSAYATALNLLLSRDSRNNVRINDTTIVFWSEKYATDFDLEEELPRFIFQPSDDPDRGVQAVKNLYNWIYTGKKSDYSESKFFIMGLAPNSARIVLRFWKMGTVKQIAKNIKMHFDDLEII